MGKGDRKTKKGKRFKGTYGNSGPRKKKSISRGSLTLETK